MIITNLRIITNDEKLGFIDGGAILVENGEIVDVGRKDELIRNGRIQEVYDGSGMFAIPGLVNPHLNLNFAFLRIPLFLDRTNILKQKRELKRKFEEVFTPELLHVVSSFSAFESLKNGVTTIIGSFISKFDESHLTVKSAFENVGIRGIMGREICGDTIRDFIKHLETDRTFHEDLSDQFYFVQLILKPHNILIPKNLEFLSSLSTSGIRFKFVMECKEEKDEMLTKYSVNFIDLLAKHGILPENSMLVPFCNLTEEELDSLASRSSSIVLTPRTNAIYGVKHTEVMGVIGRGISSGIGTGELDYNVVEEFRSFLIFQGTEKLSAESSNLFEFITSAFKGGYNILENLTGMKFGKIKPGYRADIVLLDAPELPCPKDEMLYRFIAFFLLKISNVKTVFVDGKKVLEDGRLVSTSQDEILMETSKVYRELFEDLMK
ncbi:MAG: amidohydrolase family protein [Thermotogae bacterium]|nr:amidohydrolase family protein [Thermotogota bacterium]